jgi:hypothetical protein
MTVSAAVAAALAAAPALPDQLPFEFDLDEDEPREVYTGPMRYLVSVSQLKMFDAWRKGCPRKWAMHYLAKFPREMTPALRDGIRLHRAIKDRWHGLPGDVPWETKWKPGTPTADLALAMMRHVQDRAAWVSEPTWFLDVPELDTAIYIKPDLLSGAHPGVWGLKDWKSTSARHKRSPWVLQQPEWWPNGTLPEPANGDRYFTLQNDLQSNIYSHGLMTLFGGECVDAEWIYGSKKFDPRKGELPATWSCRASFGRESARAWCESFVWPLIRTMNLLRDAFSTGQLDSVLLVPHNPYSCEHIGKFCDVLGHCGFRKSPVALEKLHLPVIPA